MVREHQDAAQGGRPREEPVRRVYRQAPQVVWRKKKKGRSAARQAKSSRTSGSHLLPAPGHSFPIPSTLPTGGMTPKPERPCSHSRVGERAATKTHRGDIATRARAPRGGGTSGAGRRGSGRTWGGRCGAGQPGWRARREPGSGNASPERPTRPTAGREAAAAASPAAGRPFPRYAPGGARFACSGLSPPRSRAPGGLEGKPGHRFADAARSVRPGLGGRQRRGAGRGRPGARGAAGGGDSGGRATLAASASKSGVAGERGAGGALRRPPLCAPGVDIFLDSRATSRRRRSRGPRRRQEGAEEGGDCGAGPRKAHILGRAAVTRRG